MKAEQVPSLNFRIGDYNTFLRQMLDRLPLETIPDGPFKGSQPLANASLENEDDFLYALLSSWAVVGDVLTFYQDRIGNEGFLQTATERLSVQDLVELIRYRLFPGQVASTYVAFLGDPSPGVESDDFRAPAATAIRSVGASPQTFETTTTQRVKAAWNALPALITPQPARISSGLDGTCVLDVAGVNTGLSPGDRILILSGPTEKQLGLLNPSRFPVLRHVTPNRQQNYTRLAWERPPSTASTPKSPSCMPSGNGSPPPDGSLPGRQHDSDEIQVIAFDAEVSLFGNDAPEWMRLPATVQQQNGGTPMGGVYLIRLNKDSKAKPLNSKIPLTAIQDLASDSDGALYIATPSGVHRLSSPQDSWTALKTGLGSADATALAVDARGYLYAGADDGSVYRSVDGGESWDKIAGLVKVQSSTSPSQQGSKSDFLPVDTNLPKVVVRWLLPTPLEDEPSVTAVLAGTDAGAYASNDTGEGWTPVNEGFPNVGASPLSQTNVVVYTLLSLGDGDSLLPSPPSPPSLPEELPAMLAATDQGVFLRQPPDESWRPWNLGLPGARQDDQEVKTAVSSAVKAFGGVWGVTEKGIYRRSVPGSTPGSMWTSANRGLPGESPNGQTGLAIHELAADPAGGALFASTESGVFQYDEIRGWRCLCATPKQFLFFLKEGPVESPGSAPSQPAFDVNGAGSPLTEFTSPPFEPESLSAALPDVSPPAETWSPVPQTVRTAFEGHGVNLSADACWTAGMDADCSLVQDGKTFFLLVDTTGRTEVYSPLPTCRLAFRKAGELTVAAGKGFCGGASTPAIKEKEWPNFSIQKAQIDLEKTYRGITKDTLILLYQAGEVESLYLAEIGEVREVNRSDFLLQSRLTRLLPKSTTPSEEANLKRFDLRAARVFVRSRELALRQFAAVQHADNQQVIPLDVDDPSGLHKGQLAVVSGKPLLLAPETHDPEDRDFVREAGGALVQRDGSLSIQLRDGKLLSLKRATLLPARAGGSSYVQPATIGLGSADDLAKPGPVPFISVKDVILDPNTVQVNANVVQVTHGESVKREILGSGNAALPNQSFTLKKPRLTFQAAQDGRTLENTLQVHVNGVPWRETPSLHGAGPNDQVYMIRINSDFTTTVLFGDGDQGARLPTGSNNIVADYKTADPALGGVAPTNIKNLVSKPLGVQGVSNPFTPTGEKAPEKKHEARRRAPILSRPLDRIVSIEDYQNFAFTQPNVVKALSEGVWDGSREQVVLTVALKAGLGSKDRKKTIEDLHQSILTHQAGARTVFIVTYRSLRFLLEALVAVDDAYDEQAVLEAAREWLLWRNGFQSRELAQGLSQAEVAAALHQVEGVRGAVVHAFGLVDLEASSGVASYIPAGGAEWDADESRPRGAELLTIGDEAPKLGVLQSS